MNEVLEGLRVSGSILGSYTADSAGTRSVLGLCAANAAHTRSLLRFDNCGY